MLFGSQRSIITNLSFSPDGKYLADLRQDEDWRGDNTVRIWDFEKGVVKHVLTGHAGAVNSISFSPDGTRIVTASEDQTVRIWDSNLAKEIFSMGTASDMGMGMAMGYRAVFSPDGKNLAVWGNRDMFAQKQVIKIFIALTEDEIEEKKAKEEKKRQLEKQAAMTLAEEFSEALRIGDIEKLDRLLGENKKRWCSSHTLFKVISQGVHPNIIKLLIEMGADVNDVNEGGGYITKTALHEAIKRNSLDIVKILIENGANIETKNINKYTPLQMAAKQGKTDIVEILIEKGADLDAVEHIDTALTMALEKGNYDIAKLLINKGAEVNIYNGRALNLADNNTEIKELLVKNGAVDYREMNSFRQDVYDGKVESVNKMLEKHPRLIYSLGSPGQTPIYRAIQGKSAEMVSLLVSKGAVINMLDLNGQAPIHYAAKNGQKAVLEVLIENGANVNIHTTGSLRTYTGCTPLHWAALNGHKEIIDILLSNGAELESQTTHGKTPLHLAVKSGNKDIVQLLLLKGANVNIADSQGHTPLHYAKDGELKKLLDIEGGVKISDLLNAIKEENLKKINEILKKSPSLAKAETGSPYGNTVFNKAIEHNNIEIVKLFIQAGIDVNYKINNGDFPLEIALGYKINPDIAKLLIENGADVNITERYSQEPMLQKAMGRRDSELVRMMVEKGADVNKASPARGTPLDMALNYSRSDEIIRIFIENGADISGEKGIEYLEKAVERKNYETVLLLLENGVDVKGDKGRAIFEKAFQESFSVNKKIIQCLVKNGVDFKGVRNRSGQNILHYSLISGRHSFSLGNGPIFKIRFNEKDQIDKEFIKDVIRKIADINAKDRQGKSPLHYAIASNDLELISFLINNGADVNTYDNNGNTLFHAIALWKNEELLELLIQKGGDINKPNNDGLTPIQYLAFYGADILQIIETKGGTSGSTLIDALIKGDIEKVRTKIIDDPEKIKLLDRAGNSLLHYAIGSENYNLAKFLIEKGIDLNRKNNNGIIALDLALRKGNLQIVKLLLDRGSTVNTQNSKFNSPLHSAIYFKDKEERKKVIHLLMKYNININVQNTWGDTILHSAVRMAENELINLILYYNPNLTLKNKNGLNPLELALDRKKLNIAKLIIEHGGSVSDPLFNAIVNNDLHSIEEYLKINPRIDYFYDSLPSTSAAYLMAFFGNIETIDLINKYGISIECQSKDEMSQSKGVSLIHNVASVGNNEMVAGLLKRGVDVNCPSKGGDTPIIYASLFGQKDTVLFLLKNGADIQLKDKQGGTCLHAACKNGHDEIVRILIENGSEINSKGQNDLTPLHLAANQGHEKVVRTLIEKDADPNSKDNENRTPLDLAKASKHEEVANLLLKSMGK
ncbi:MAG: ankyrin repeat domain-containing protein [Candidatus Scalindua sp.]